VQADLPCHHSFWAQLNLVNSHFVQVEYSDIGLTAFTAQRHCKRIWSGLKGILLRSVYSPHCIRCDKICSLLMTLITTEQTCHTRCLHEAIARPIAATIASCKHAFSGRIVTTFHSNEKRYTDNKLSLPQVEARMWADAQRDGRPAEYRWRPLLNAVEPLSDVAALTKPGRETR